MLSGCGKSGNGLIDDDIINNDVYDDSDEYLGFYTLDPSDLIGTWLIENVYDEDSKQTVAINKTLTILPFDVSKAEVSNEMEFPFDNIKYSRATYEETVVTENNGGLKYNSLSLNFIGKTTSSITEMKVYMFSTLFFEDNGSTTLVVLEPRYSNGKIKGSGSIRIAVTDETGYSSKMYSGEVTLTKIK